MIVPTRNEASYIRECLDSLLAALPPVGGGEVLVVDGRSTDDTLTIVEEYSTRHPFVRVVPNPDRVTPSAFNLGVQQARSQMVAIVSAHSRVDPSFFASALARLAASDVSIVGGPVRTEPGAPGALAWLLAQVVSHPFGVGNSRFRISDQAGEVDAIPFGVFRRQVFDTVGLFDTALVRNQDTEFFGRVARAGLRVYLDPAVRSVYRARATVGGLLRQGCRNAYWNVLVWRQNPAAFQWRHAIPGIFVASLCLTALLAPVSGILRTLLGLELATYALVAGLASAQIAYARRRPLALLLPPFFFVYHVTYGTGTLAGVSWLFRTSRARP